MDKRILELALEALEQKKLALEAEIRTLQFELKGGIRQKAAPPAARRKPKTAAQRKALSIRMKAYWDAKRGQAAKSRPAKKAAAAQPKIGPQSAAARKAQSLRMLAYWKKKKAEMAKANKKPA